MGAHRCGEHADAIGFTGGVAVGEQDHRRDIKRRLPYFRLADQRARLTCGSLLSVTADSKASSFMQILMLFCEFCNSKCGDPNGVIQVLLDSQ